VHINPSTLRILFVYYVCTLVILLVSLEHTSVLQFG
jgi:hypothetical protein